MTICVFNKGEFVDFWLNNPNDENWVERTISAKNWKSEDVEIYLYELDRNSDEVFSFDSQKNLQKMKEEIVETIVDEQPQFETILTVEQTYNKIPFFINGVMV